MRKTKKEIRGNEDVIRSISAEVGEFLGETPVEKKPLKWKEVTKKKWFRWACVGVALCLVIGISSVLRAHPKQMELTYVQAEVKRGDITQSINATGTVQPAASYELTALVSGEVLEAPFEEGQTVQEGDLLYVIDSSDIESNLERAQNAYNRALDSYNNLLESREDYNIKAPSAGVITELNVQAGDKVNAGAKIGTVADRSVAYLKVPFFSEDAAKLYAGQSATVTIASSFESIVGVVDSISSLEEVGLGGALVRQVKIKVTNPRGISAETSATATVGGYECNAGAKFTFPADKPITAQASGEIKALKLKEGNSVGKDMVIAVIDEEGLEDQLKNAKSNLDDAKLSLDNAQDQLDNYRITAPISGTVIEKNLKAGDTLDSANKSANTGALAIIYDLSHLEFTVNVDELDIKKVAVGQTVNITADSLEGKLFTGKVSKVSINGTTQNGATSYPVTVIIDDGSELLPGMNVSADILITEHTDVLVVPSEAVARGNTVLVSTKTATGKKALADGAEEEATAPGYVRVKVSVGANDENFVEITEGLSEGDQITYQPAMPDASNNPFAQMGISGGGMPSGGMHGGMGNRGGMPGGMPR